MTETRNLTPLQRGTLALLPLLIEADNLIGVPDQRQKEAVDAIYTALDALYRAAEPVSYILLRKAGWTDEFGATRDLMNRIDAATAELDAIERGEPLPRV